MFRTVHVGEAVVPLFARITVEVEVPLILNIMQPGAYVLAVVVGLL